MEARTYDINEIFYSIQGEGFFVGQPMVFIRFAGCNFNCDFCDTDHSSKLSLTAEQIIEAIYTARGFNTTRTMHVCLTGGEPTLQVDGPLLRTLAAYDLELHLETNGILVPIMTGARPYRSITISPKLPEPKPFCAPWTACMLKVVYDPAQLDLVHRIMDEWGGAADWTRKYLQPVTCPDGSTNREEVVAYIKANPTWLLSVQLHKIIGVR